MSSNVLNMGFRPSRRVKTAAIATFLFIAVLLGAQHHGSTLMTESGLATLKGDGWLWPSTGDVGKSNNGYLRNEDHCEGWDPEKDEVDDPVNCLRARQYRQTWRVLDREQRAEQ